MTPQVAPVALILCVCMVLRIEFRTLLGAYLCSATELQPQCLLGLAFEVTFSIETRALWNIACYQGCGRETVGECAAPWCARKSGGAPRMMGTG